MRCLRRVGMAASERDRCCSSSWCTVGAVADTGALRRISRCFALPPIQRLTSPRHDSGRHASRSQGPLLSSAYVRTMGTEEPNTFTPSSPPRPAAPAAAASPSRARGPYQFAMKDHDRGVLDHGLSPQALDYVAEAEEQYRASSAYLHEAPGGAGSPEITAEHVDSRTGATHRTRRVAAPIGETYVPSSKARHAIRGTTGELAYQRETPRKFLMDERAQLNLKKERQLEELLASPMALLPRAEEVALTLSESFYEPALALQPRTAEVAMQLFGQASLQLRLEGIPRAGGGAREPAQQLAGGSPDAQSTASPPALEPAISAAPFLRDMQRLHAHQKVCFVKPTALTIECMMTALSAIKEPSQSVFHFANRLLLDCDRFVVLPTRTTYAAYFTVCRVNDAVVPYAVARMKDAVVNLGVSLDAPMAAELLSGLNEGGHAEEAVALLARMEKVPMTTGLLNASLETLLLSSEPLACFSALDAACGGASREVRPNADTYSLLLLACEKSGQWNRVTAVLGDMQKRRVRGNTQTLNLLLKGLLTERLTAYAEQLYKTMRAKGVPVWPALEDGVQRAVRRHQLSPRRAKGDSGHVQSHPPPA